jgi:hypothetical protein
MALVPFPYGSYGPPPYGPTPGRVRDRLRRQAVLGLGLVVVGWLAGLTGSGRGWLTITLAWLVVLLLGVHRASGAGWLARVVAEYTVVAVLAVLLATTTGTPQPPATHPTTAATAAGDGRSVVTQARDRLAGWWQWADQQADRHGLKPPPTTAAPRTR